MNPTTITLKNGETVAVTVVQAPNPEWAARIEPMLQHKGLPWTWQNHELLHHETGLAARFYLLHRNGRPFANILLAETGGVALLGHVWTEPADRGHGASSQLMDLALADFARRGGEAIFLGTEPESPPWHFYRRRGFEPIEEGSGDMVRYRTSRSSFTAEWFGATESRIESLGWKHWPAAAPLAVADFPGRVRLAATGLIGRRLHESPFLPVIREQQRRRAAKENDCAVALTSPRGAVLGWASCLADPIWPGRSIVDVFCAPGGWPKAAEMIQLVQQASAGKAIAYCDAESAEKERVLQHLGYRVVARLPSWLSPLSREQGRTDITVWENYAPAGVP